MATGLSKLFVWNLKVASPEGAQYCQRFSIDRSGCSRHGALIDCQLLAQVYAHLKSFVPANRSPLS